MADDTAMTDAPPPPARPAGPTETELDAKYPNRPFNSGHPLFFRELMINLFNPLLENKQKQPGPPLGRRHAGPHRPQTASPHELRRQIIERFITRWRREVGPDLFPAFRLILPDKDRERAMYGLKEKAIAKVLVSVMKIDKHSADAKNLLDWKLPSQSTLGVSNSGDFAARCKQVLSKRQLRHEPGDLDIGEVNTLLDRLSLASKEQAQIPIFETFYRRMSADEMMWLIRIILRQTKVGATEKTFFDIYHPDADLLFNVSSNLRRVCWELHDPSIRLEPAESDVNLMQCFQPQLAQFQMRSFEKMVQQMHPTDEDREFWIEEKLDGERMQLHMCEDSSIKGNFRFAFFSRKAKDYTYLYGSSLDDPTSALMKHLKQAFHPGVRNIILDGEMITFDTVLAKIVPFGTLKTAALDAKQETDSGKDGARPVFKVFDILYLNDKVLTAYTLRDRRAALEQAIQPVSNRLEIHTYTTATKVEEIEPALRTVIADSSEGLVLKSPRSRYRLNARTDDWIKVKPEYMSEYGEALDCLVVGGYYGLGRLGGTISSFLCGLRVNQQHINAGASPEKCWSFFKVGGGLAKSDYDQVHQAIGDKWQKYDKDNPPIEYLELGGWPKRQYEIPDVWIRPSQSVVFSVKGASIHTTDSFRTGMTLRFPRFKALRLDRTWESALTVRGFVELKNRAEEEIADKKFTMEENRRKARKTNSRKKEKTVAGAVDAKEMARAMEAFKDENDPTKALFKGLTFFVLSECVEPKRYKCSKTDVEAFVKAHGGMVTQKMPPPLKEQDPEKPVIPLSDRDVVKVTTLKAKGKGLHSVIRPRWVFECVAQAKYDALHYDKNEAPRYLLPYEPRQVKFVAETDQEAVGASVDEHGDAFARDVADVDEMRELLAGIGDMDVKDTGGEAMLRELEERGQELGELKGWMFKGCRVWCDDGRTSFEDGAMDVDGTTEHFDVAMESAARIVRFAAGSVANILEDDTVTHVIVPVNAPLGRTKKLRHALKSRRTLPRTVTAAWVSESWKEGTRLDEERFAP